MADKPKLIVLKFGSSVLRDEKDLPRAVHEIYRWWRQGAQVLAVVSAFGNTTDQLLRRAESVCEQPERTMLPSLLATGETIACALLGMNLKKAGIPAKVLDTVQAGLRTAGGVLDADLVAVDVARLCGELRQAVVVLPGFIGRSEDGNTTLLGRGGSDLSALFLAHRLGGECILLKDVDGIYASDPARATTPPLRFAEIKYETASGLAGKLVQSKAIHFAAAHRIQFQVTSVGSAHQTIVGSPIDRLAVTQINPKPLRVALLGCGTVGGGVYQALAALPELFTVTGVGTRNRERACSAGVPDRLITDSLEQLIEDSSDVVIEAIGGTKSAENSVSGALRAGSHVVTANKALMALEGERLTSLATDYGVTLRYSAAVGGALPALETIERARSHGPLRSFRGVLNGTTNFVLDRLAEGQDMKGAVGAAQQAGYAEADCRFDLNGTDAAQKLILLARKAFDSRLPFDTIERVSLEEVDQQRLRKSRSRGQVIRYVASCHQETGRLRASVKPVELLHTDPLASVTGTENRLLIEFESGASFIVSGQGAGRWPTAEAVMADLLDIRRETQFISENEAIENREECVA